MESAFWQKRWADNQIGFHQRDVNPYLREHWSSLNLAPGSQVLVPLCGKSLDMAWLAGQGYRVLGVELARQAVEDFFTEQRLQPELSRHGAFEVWRAGELQLWCGSVFDLRPDDLAGCAGLYDRAAMIALPEGMRGHYFATLSGGLSRGCEGLAITLDYDQSRIDGPPFSVSDDEVRRGLAGWHVDELEALDVIQESPKFLQAGVDRLVERVYRVRR